MAVDAPFVRLQRNLREGGNGSVGNQLNDQGLSGETQRRLGADGTATFPRLCFKHTS